MQRATGGCWIAKRFMQVSVLLGQDGGVFQVQVAYDVGSGPLSVSLGDVNGDGHLDIVTANWFADNVSVLLGREDGTFDNLRIGRRLRAVLVAGVW